MQFLVDSDDDEGPTNDSEEEEIEPMVVEADNGFTCQEGAAKSSDETAV